MPPFEKIIADFIKDLEGNSSQIVDLLSLHSNKSIQAHKEKYLTIFERLHDLEMHGENHEEVSSVNYYHGMLETFQNARDDNGEWISQGNMVEPFAEFAKAFSRVDLKVPCEWKFELLARAFQ